MYGNHNVISNALDELRQGFTSSLPARLKDLEQIIDATLRETSPQVIQENIQNLLIALNNLAGTCSTYGYFDISKYARLAEQRLTEFDPDSRALAELMEKLRAYLQVMSICLEDINPSQLSEQTFKQLISRLEMNRYPGNTLIYIADEDTRYVQELSNLLASFGLQIQHFSTLYELEERIRFQAPDILILNTKFDGSNFSGFDFISNLNQSLEEYIPTIFLADYDDPEHRYRATSVRASFYLKKPPSITELLHAIEQLVNRDRSEPYKVLIVEEDKPHSQYIAHLLQQNGIETRVVNDSREVLYEVNKFWPEVILLDSYMPGYNGIELASMIRLDAKQQFTSILFLSTELDANQQLEALALGGDDFLAKPIDPRILIRTVEARGQRARAHNNAYFELRHTINELEQFKIALDQHAIVSIADPEGRITYANPKFCEVSGYSPEELIGKKHNILNSGTHSRQFFSAMWQTITAGNTWHGEIKNRTKNGSEYWVASTISPILDETGKPYQYISIRTDITELKKITEDLATSEERLRRSQDYAHIGTWDWNIRSGELLWSKYIGPLFGYDDLVDTTYDNFINAVHPDDRQYVIDAVSACVERGEAYDIEHRIIRTSGEIRWLSEKGDVVRNQEGEPLHMLGVVQDITDRKEMELKLMESQAKLKAMFDLSPLGFALTDMDGNYLEFNDAFREICGYSADELCQLDYWTLTPEQFKPQEAEQLKSLEETGFYGPYEKLYRKKDGTLIPISLNGMLIKGRDNKDYIWSIVEDITNRKKSEQALIAAKEAAESANRAKSEFLSRMSHELRTPMNAILGFAQLMDTDPTDRLSDNQKTSNEQILKAGWHLLDLINEILDLSKIESGNFELSMEKINASEVIKECLLLIKQQADQFKIHIENNIHDNIYILADRTRFKQVCLNLLTNAIKYNHSDGKVVLSSHYNPEHGTIKFIIRDTGKGINSKQMAHLFEPFNRLGAEDSAIEGTGIGLVISRRLVEIMGGDIGVDSSPNVGSSFFFSLPIADIDADSDMSVSSTTMPDKQPTMKNGDLNILYVEDNPANLKLIGTILGRIDGIKLHSATTAMNGLKAAKAIIPDLILLDIHLPDISGIELANILQADNDTAHIPLIAISANAMPKDISNALSNGFSDYLTKPINVKKFVELVNRYMHSEN